MLLYKGLSKYVIICLDAFVNFKLTKYLGTPLGLPVPLNRKKIQIELRKTAKIAGCFLGSKYFLTATLRKQE